MYLISRTLAGLVVMALCVSTLGCTNPNTPAGYVGYVTQGAIFGKAKFHSLQRGYQGAEGYGQLPQPHDDLHSSGAYGSALSGDTRYCTVTKETIDPRSEERREKAGQSSHRSGAHQAGVTSLLL